MTQYLVAIHHPDDYDPFVAEDEAMHRDIDALNDEMVAADVRWMLECADMDEALEWGRKAVVACRAPVEVRQLH